MKRGQSTGNTTKARLAGLGVINDIGRIACYHAYLVLDDVRAELWDMAGQNRRQA